MKFRERLAYWMISAFSLILAITLLIGLKMKINENPYHSEIILIDDERVYDITDKEFYNYDYITYSNRFKAPTLQLDEDENILWLNDENYNSITYKDVSYNGEYVEINSGEFIKPDYVYRVSNNLGYNILFIYNNYKYLLLYKEN